MSAIFCLARTAFCALIIFGAIFTLRSEVDSFNSPMKKTLTMAEKSTGIPSALPIQYLQEIITGLLVCVIVGVAQMIFGFKVGGYLALMAFTTLTMVRDCPCWHKDEMVAMIQTIVTLKNISVIGGICFIIGANCCK